MFRWKTWTLNERKAIVILIVLVTLMIVLNNYYTNSIYTEELRISEEERVYFEALLAKWEREDDFVKSDQRKDSLTVFDPNDLDADDWMDLGFSQKQSESILRYKKHLGSFTSPEQLQKCFVISEEKYEELLPYIEIKEVFLLMNINRSDSTELLQLNGIGPYYAGKIVTYRNRLGGYHSKEQLLELWKFGKDRLEELESNIEIGGGVFRFIDLNKDSLKVFLAHPYLNYKEARAIVNYRDQHAPFSKVDQLKACIALSDSSYRKIVPYLSIH